MNEDPDTYELKDYSTRKVEDVVIEKKPIRARVRGGLSKPTITGRVPTRPRLQELAKEETPPRLAGGRHQGERERKRRLKQMNKT